MFWKSLVEKEDRTRIKVFDLFLVQFLETKSFCLKINRNWGFYIVKSASPYRLPHCIIMTGKLLLRRMKR